MWTTLLNLPGVKTVKNWLMAAALFAVGLAAAVFWGRRKQAASDSAQASKVVTDELNRISQTAQATTKQVDNLPPTGAGSANDQLRQNWKDD
jgi:predicted naringenin-chalcone synthase